MVNESNKGNAGQTGGPAQKQQATKKLRWTSAALARPITLKMEKGGPWVALGKEIKRKPEPPAVGTVIPVATPEQMEILYLRGGYNHLIEEDVPDAKESNT